MRKQLIALAAFAFAVAASAGVYSVKVEAEEVNTLDGFSISATAVRTADPSGLRFKIDVPEAMANVSNAYTKVTVTPAGEAQVSTDVEATVWRADASGWNTVLLGIPEGDYTTEVTAQAFITVGGVEYQTAAVSSSIAKTAAEAMASGQASAEQVGQYVETSVTLSMNQKNADMFIGEEALQLTATTSPAGYPVVWSSDNEEVATVDNAGTVTAVGKGKANVTATLGNKSVSCAVTVYEKYEIETAAEFLAMPTSDPYVYCTLKQDVDFTGTLVNGSLDTLCVGMTEYNWQEYTAFEGVLDGCGYGLKNVTMKGANSENDNGLFACVIRCLMGTVKNLHADMTLTTAATQIKNVGFIDQMSSDEAVIENCYFVLNVNQTAYNTQVPPSAIVAYASKMSTIRNCIGVLNFADTLVRDNGAGYAAIVGRTIEPAFKIENCYGVVTSKDSVKAAQLHSPEGYGTSVVPTVTNSTAHQTMKALFAAAKTGLTAENGWNELWKVEGDTLTFGDLLIYETMPELDATSAELFLTNGENVNGVAESLQLNVLNVSATATWASSSPAVATVSDSGLVTPLTAGTTTITATVNGKSCTCDITVYDYYEIDTVAEFLAMETSNQYVYYALTKNIDFTGTLINGSLDTLCVGMTTWAGSITPFAGVLDGCGYGLTNVTMKGANKEDDNGIFACVIRQLDGTVKNLYANMTLTTSATSVKQVGFFDAISGANALVENCCFVINVNQTAYSTSKPPAAIASYASKGATIQNCIGILNFTDTLVRDNGLGYAALVGQVTDTNFKITNCYGVVTSKDSVKAAQLYADSNYAASYLTPTVTNSTAHTTLAEMFDAAKTGMTAENGWNNLWSVDAAAGTLKFGATTIYSAE